MHLLALSIVMFSQGVPFFHAGDDLLRSKSLERNSYDAGDWFNRLDWTLQTNNWGAGLPIHHDSHTLRFQDFLNQIGDLTRHPFLNLQTAGKSFGYTSEL